MSNEVTANFRKTTDFSPLDRVTAPCWIYKESRFEAFLHQKLRPSFIYSLCLQSTAGNIIHNVTAQCNCIEKIFKANMEKMLLRAVSLNRNLIRGGKIKFHYNYNLTRDN